MHYSGFEEYDLVNGTGVRFTLYTSGCTHCCKGCFNKLTWRKNYGTEYTKEFEDFIIDSLKDTKRPRDGLTLLGGDPLFKQSLPTIINLMQRVKTETGKNIWLWTGYTLDQIKSDLLLSQTLQYIDVLIDGKFVEELKDPSLKFRGSSNQNILHKDIDY